MKINSILESYVGMKILICLHEHEELNALRLSRITDITYSHILKLIEFFSEKGLVTEKKIGREKIITLTEKGKEIAKLIKKIMEIENK